MKIRNNKRGLEIKKICFQNVPNLSLRGNTFDVNHLHKFITTGGLPSPLADYPKATRTPAPELNTVKSQLDSMLFTRSKFSRGLSQQRNKSNISLLSKLITFRQ